MTRSGSAAANGIAPSVMKDAPEHPGRLAVLPLGLGEQPAAYGVASAIASGGTMPAAITAAMTLRLPWLGPAQRPPVAKA